MATNKAFEPDYDEETAKGIVLATRRASIDLENRRRLNESATFNNNNEPLDTYFADEKIHIPDRVRKPKFDSLMKLTNIFMKELVLFHLLIEWIQLSHIVGLHRTRFLDVNCSH